MPRGIPNKPKAEQPVTDTKDRVYHCYVHGETVNDIAARFELETQEVLEMIQSIEQGRG